MANIWDKFDKEIDIAGLAEDVKEAAENGGNFKDVPHGEYEVEVNKLELVESKKGDPSLKYNQHITLSAFTHKELAAFTHNQLRNEVFENENYTKL